MAEFEWGSLMSGVSDTFSELGKAYLGTEAIKAQAGAIRAQTEYNALTGYNGSYLSNPNAYPMTPAQLAAAQAQRSGGMAISTPMLLLGGGALLLVVLLVK